MIKLSIQDIYSQEIALQKIGLKESEIDNALIILADSFDCTPLQQIDILRYISTHIPLNPEIWA